MGHNSALTLPVILRLLDAYGRQHIHPVMAVENQVPWLGMITGSFPCLVWKAGARRSRIKVFLCVPAVELGINLYKHQGCHRDQRNWRAAPPQAAKRVKVEEQRTFNIITGTTATVPVLSLCRKHWARSGLVIGVQSRASLNTGSNVIKPFPSDHNAAERCVWISFKFEEIF